MKTAGRYDILEILGEGGMGIVYRAFDPVMGRDVTLKTIRNPQDKQAIELFKRECSVLSGLAHPNIVEIYDVGEIDEPTGKRPYFVMPLLRGTTLDKLIKTSSARLTTDRSIHIMSQICRGLQAAHEQGLVHRDLKPSNLFILDDDSVKIIDFGVAHMIDQRTATGLKGTPLYMAPEQLLMKQPSPLSDQFAIAVVCYEMLARRHPFSVPGYKDLTEAILKHTPAPVCDLNQSVNRPISQVVHKALTKEAIHRFADVREFGDFLQKALRNETIAIFDESKLEPRLERARKALTAADLDFAAEIIRELESENLLHPEIQRLRQEIDQATDRRTVTQLLETARRRFEEQEYLLGLQKVQEVLNLDPSNTDAFTLKAAIENERSVSQIDGSLRLAQQHLDNHAYDLARRAAEKVLQLRPKDTRAQTLLAEADRREQESVRIRVDKEKAYQAAVQAFGNGDVSAALSKLERVLDLDRRSPESTTPEKSATYQKLYEDVRLRHDQLEAQFADARRFKADGNLTSALAVCDDVLKVYPNNVVFQSLKYDVEEARREEISSYIATVEKEVAAEPDMNRKVAILEVARQKHPNEERFSQSLTRVKARRDLVQGIAARAAALEEAGQFSEALGQWEILRTTYPQHPGLEVEIERLKHRREQQKKAETKANWVTQIDDALARSDYSRAEGLADEAMAEFKADAELLVLKKNAQLGLARAEEAHKKLADGRDFLAAGSHEEAFGAFRAALKLNPHNQVVRNALTDALLQHARALLETDWNAAEPLLNEALDHDPGNPLAKSLRTLIGDRRESEDVTAALSRARELQAQGDIRNAILELDRALEKYPGRERILLLRTSLLGGLPPAERDEMRVADLRQVKQLVELSERSEDARELGSIFQQTLVYKTKYAGDTEFSDPLTVLESRVKKAPEPAEVPADRLEQRTDPARNTAAPVPGGARALAANAVRGTVNRYKQVAGFLGRQPMGVLWPVIAGSAIVLLALVVGTSGPHSKPQPRTVPRAVTTVAVTLDGTTGQAKILNSRTSEDVTARKNGLDPGDYDLTDNKPGFQPVSQHFHLDAGSSPVTITAQWQPLPATLSVQAAGPGGKWTLDERPLTAEELGKIPMAGLGGEHTLIWADGTTHLNLRFSVKEGAIQVEHWEPPRTAAVIAFAVGMGTNGMSLRLSGLKMKYQTTGGSPVNADMDQEIPWTARDSVQFLPTWSAMPLWTSPSHDPAAQGAFLYVWLYPVPPAKKIPDPQPAANPTPVQPPPVTSVVPPPLTPEQIREQKRKDALNSAGVSEKILKSGQ